MSPGHCWWCGSTDLSAEHKYKASRVRRALQKDDSLHMIPLEEAPRAVRGRKMNALKFERNLCEDCNNSRSSAFDRSFTHLLRQLENIHLEENIFNTIDTSVLFPQEGIGGMRNVVRYVLKHAYCRLAPFGLYPGEDSLQFLSGQPDFRFGAFAVVHKSWVLDLKPRFYTGPLLGINGEGTTCVSSWFSEDDFSFHFAISRNKIEASSKICQAGSNVPLPSLNFTPVFNNREYTIRKHGEVSEEATTRLAQELIGDYERYGVYDPAVGQRSHINFVLKRGFTLSCLPC